MVKIKNMKNVTLLLIREIVKRQGQVLEQKMHHLQMLIEDPAS